MRIIRESTEQIKRCINQNLRQKMRTRYIIEPVSPGDGVLSRQTVPMAMVLFDVGEYHMTDVLMITTP
jgi:hypothetical protein